MGQIVHNTALPNDGLGDELRQAFTDANTMNAELYATKVDKVAGKGLSENDYTNADKAKVDAINTAAEENVQSDWNELDPSSDAFILGKPIFQSSDIDVSALWTSGLTFAVIANSFPVNNIMYPATAADVTLDASDPTLDRIDLIVAIKPTSPATVGTVGFVKGTPATTALVVPPDFDPSIHYIIKQVIIRAAATQPEGVSTTPIYRDVTTWSKVLTANVVENTSDPSEGSNCLEATNSTSADSASFTAPAPLSTEDVGSITFDLKLKEVAVGKSIYITFLLAGDLILKYNFASPVNGFDDSNLDYQTITINSDKLNLPIQNFDEIIVRPFFDSTGWFLDNIVLHTGSGSEVIPATGIPEAPEDGVLYGRKNKAWEAVAGQAALDEVKAHAFNATSTGLLMGGALSINGGDNTKFDIALGAGYVTDNATDPLNPTSPPVAWTAFSAQTVTNIATQPVTYISISDAGAIIQDSVIPDATKRRSQIFLGVLVHSNNTNLNAINNLPVVAYDINGQLQDLINALGFFSVSGNVISANGANLNIDKSGGVGFKAGSNFHALKTNPHEIAMAALVAATFRYRNQDSAEGSDVTAIDPTQWDDGGVTTTIPTNNNATIQRVYIFPSNLVRIQRGQQVFANLSTAIDASGTEDFIEEANISQNGLFLGSIIIKKNATDLSDPSQAKVIPASGISGSSGSTTTLQGAYDVSTQPQIITDITRQAVVYQGGTGTDSDNVLEVKNNAGTKTIELAADGSLAAANVTATGIVKAANMRIESDADPTLIINTITANQANAGRISFREIAGTEEFYLHHDGAVNEFYIGTRLGGNAIQIRRADGNVGFGATPSAAYKILVNGNALFGANGLAKITDDANGATFGIANNKVRTYYQEVVGQRFYTNAVEVMRLSNSGDLGLGTSAPLGRFHIHQDNAPAALYIQGGLNSEVAVGGEIGSIEFKSNDSSVVGNDIGARVVTKAEFNNGALVGLAFYTAGATLAERMRIKNNGFIGMGTDDPLVALDIQNDNPFMRLLDTNSTVRNAGFRLSTAGGEWYVASGFSTGTDSELNIGRNNSTAFLKIATNGDVKIGSTAQRFLLRNDGVFNWGSSANYGTLTWATNDAIIGGQSGSKLSLNANGSTKATILTTGEFGIGTTTPAEALDVVGNAQTSGTIQSHKIYRQTSGAFTLALTDRFNIIETKTAGAITIPANSTVAFPIGTEITIINTDGVTNTTFITAGGVSMNNNVGGGALATYDRRTLTKIGTDAWILSY